MILYLDTETRSPVPITAGVCRYATQVEVIIATWAIDDGEVQTWDGLTSRTPPEELIAAAQVADRIIAHNAQFDRTVLGVTDWWPQGIPIERWYCTMAQAFRHGLPGSLDKLCTVFKIAAAEAKSKDGRELIQLFCKPRKDGSWATPQTHAAQWYKFKSYAGSDIRALREVHRVCPKWNDTPEELALWHLDQRINDRGFAVDVDFATAALRAVTTEKKRLGDRTEELTDGLVLRATQRDALLRYLFAEYGIDLPDLRTDTVERRLNDPELPEFVKELLRIRLEASKSSTAKYQTLLRTHVAGRIHGALQYCGAYRTRRWGGRGFQPQNLQRPTHNEAEIEDFIAAAKAGCEDLIGGSVMRLAGSSMRGSIVAAPGKKLVVSDLSGIEGRVAPWIAGEEWKLDAFRAYDRGDGPDLYKVSYGRSFDVPPETVGDKSPERQVGKVCLAGDTMVLCRSGWQRLDHVQGADEVWDGEHWTKHGGLACKGLKPVVSLLGISLTPDHLVLCGDQWKQAAEVAASSENTSLALAKGAASLPSPGTYPPGPDAGCTGFSSVVTATNVNMLSKATTSKTNWLPDATCAQNPQTGKNDTGSTQKYSRTTNTDDGFSTGWRQPSRDVTARPRSNIMRTAAGASEFATNGAKTEPLSYDMCRHALGGMIRFWKWTARTIAKDTNRGISGSSRSGRTTKTGAPSPPSKRSALVYDLTSVGSKHRFLVWSDKGPILVHNCELALGYEGGVAAFVAMAATYRIDLEKLAAKSAAAVPGHVAAEARQRWARAKRTHRTYGLPENIWVACMGLVLLWRAAHPEISGLWRKAENAARMAIMNRNGKVFPAGKLGFSRRGNWLLMHLPSGGHLCYPGAGLDGDAIRFKAWNVYTASWRDEFTYGGKLVENATQAVARDVLAGAMPVAEAAGYPIVLTVHDELVCETPDSSGYTAETLNGILAADQTWTDGLPLAAVGFETHRYRKG